jgi:hypothetical protein
VLSQFSVGDVRKGVDGSLVCYARAVVEDEWPRMDAGERSPVVDSWALSLLTTLERAKVPTDKQSIDTDRLVSEQDELEQARFDRLQEAHTSVPSLLWVALITGALAVIIGLCSFGARVHRVGPQIGMAAVVALVVSLNLLVIPFLDAPFQSSGAGIPPKAMEDALALMEGAHADRHANEPIPCDESGTPTA